MRKPLLIPIGSVALLLAVLAAVFFIRPFAPATTPSEDGAASAEQRDEAPAQRSPVAVIVPPQPAGEEVSAIGATPAVVPPERQPYTPLLYDDFSQITSGWTPLFVDAQGTVNGYSAESFAFSTATPGRLLFNVLPRVSLTPTRYSVDLLPVEGSGMFGLLLEVRGDPANYSSLAFHGVGLRSDGEVLVLVKGAGTELEVVPVPNGRTSPLSPGKVVGLRVDRFGESLTIVLDGEEGVTVTTAPSEAGTVGFFALADDRLSVHFDNLLLTAAPASPEAACAQIRPLFHDPAAGEALTGEDVALMQRRLARLGYIAGVGAAYGPEAAAAVAQFQARNGLTASGIVDSQTWCQLLSGRAILAVGDLSERDALRGRYRAVAIDPGALPAPLLVSVRGDERRWQIALALPGRAALHYIDTGGDALDPAWLPTQNLLAFSSVRTDDGKEAIWILNTLTGQLKRASSPEINGKYPVWSPDGRVLMFTGEVVEGEDKKARNYTYTVSNGQVAPWGGEPAGWSDWSPVGTVIFTRWTGRSFDIFAAGADGANEVNLTNTDDFNEDIPAWSPSGDQIVFVRNPRGKPDDRQLYIMQADGSEVRPLTSLPGPNSNPVWLDSSTIVFANQPNEEVRRPYMLRLPDDLRQLSASDERVWFMQRFAAAR